LEGAPAREMASAAPAPEIAFAPAGLPGVKLRLLVKEGDAVRRGQPILRDKARPGLTFAAPATGTIRSIAFGPRRILERVVMAPAAEDEPQPYERFDPAAVCQAPRERVLDSLLRSGYFAFFRRRPFSTVPKPEAMPRDIFVNGMNTAPFLADIHVLARGFETAFQAGLDALTRLTTGRVYLCLADGAPDPLSAVSGARHVEIRTFAGPHPSGNSSVHIHHLAPIRPGDEVWTIRAANVVRIGRLLMEGATPADQTVALAGPAVKKEHRRYYRAPAGASLDALLRGRLCEGETRVVSGDALAGIALPSDGFLPPDTESLTVLPEDRERHFLGWAAPGVRFFSASRLFASRWWPAQRPWALGTNMHGRPRAMVVTGLYDRYLPMRILPDYLIRAVLARDWEEAVKLGLLEVDPEDFALCAFACPSKMDLVGLVRDGLERLESEGL
jgi:Na+-transporting NADH:ubiquinone oxidoreductase subunit A